MGAVIYLSSNRPLRISDFFTAFHENWPDLSLERTGREPHRAFFRAGRTDFAFELQHSAVPLAITEPVANSTLHWPTAAEAIAQHVAHFELSSSCGRQNVLTLACDLTRVIASLLSVTDSLAVCWLNGPALNPAKTFISTASEMFATGLYPLSLWTAARWDADARSLSTHGMEQFDAPDLVLVQQPDPDPLMVDYLLQVALSLLTSHHPIAEGETIEGPHGRLKVKPGGSKGKKMLILEPSC